jgi:hypothetical protein
VHPLRSDPTPDRFRIFAVKIFRACAPLLLSCLLGGCNTLSTLASQVSETPLPPRVAKKLYGVCRECHEQGVVPGCEKCVIVQQKRRMLAATPARQITPEMEAEVYNESAATRQGDTHTRSDFSQRDIGPKDAVRIVSQKIGYRPGKNSRLEIDGLRTRNGRKYFVVQGYNNIITDPIQQTGHSATWGWFFVDAKTGTAYEWNLVEEKLIPL